MIVRSNIENNMIYSELECGVIGSTIINDYIYSDEVDYASISEIIRILEDGQARLTEDSQTRLLE